MTRTVVYPSPPSSGPVTGPPMSRIVGGLLAAAAASFTGTVAETQDDQIATASGWVEVTGTVAETQDNQTSTASGTVTAEESRSRTFVVTAPAVQASQRLHRAKAPTVVNLGPAPIEDVVGSLAETQDHQTSTASGVVTAEEARVRSLVVGTAAQTAQRLRRQAFAAFVDLGAPLIATEDITGSLAETQDNQTSTAAGTISISGSLAETQDNQTSTASGTVTIAGNAGSVAETQDDQTSTATGIVASGVTGSLAETQDNQTSTASGKVGQVGTAAVTQANQVAAASGWISITGSAACTQANQTSSASGTVPIVGAPVASFTPPLIQGNPLEGHDPHRLNRLMRFVGNWAQGATVWKDSQGVWHEDHTAYQGGATHTVHNQWVNGTGPITTTIGPDEGLATAQRVYLGGHVYQITQEEVDELTAAGYSANIVPLT